MPAHDGLRAGPAEPRGGALDTLAPREEERFVDGYADDVEYRAGRGKE
jgi:hypothetical protein